MDKPSYGKSQLKKLKNLKTNLNLVRLSKCKVSKSDFLLKHLTRTIYHVSPLTELQITLHLYVRNIMSKYF